MTGRVVHFEIPADDVGRASSFYREAFGWTISPMPEISYTIVSTVATDDGGTPTEPGAINGGMLPRDEYVSSPVITVQVDDVAQALARVEQLGGTIVRDKFEVAGMGFAAYVTDSEDNVLGLWEDAT